MPSEPVANPVVDTAMLVFIDGCAINRFALINVDPVRALAGSGLTLAVTPDLEAEYLRALDHLFVPSYVKALLRAVLGEARRIASPGASPSTDATLIRLARTALVITDDLPLSRRETDSPGLVAWSELGPYLRDGGTLADDLRRRAALIGHIVSAQERVGGPGFSSSCSDHRPG